MSTQDEQDSRLGAGPRTQHRFGRVEPLTVPLTFLVAFLLATGRWGSYLGVPSRSIFVTDVALVVATLWWTVARSSRFDPRLLRPLIPLMAFTLWAVCRFVVGRHYDIVAFRDLAPYIYALVAIAACWRLASVRVTRAVVEASLVLHLAWLLAAFATPDWAAGLPLLDGKVRVFELRHDFDGAVVAVLVCAALLRAAQRNLGPARRVIALGVAVVACYTILQLGSRAGVLALAAALIALGVRRLHLLRRISPRSAVAGSTLILAAAVVILPQTYLFDRLTTNPDNSDSASGTLIARQEAWTLVLEDLAETPGRLAFGSGFGPDFLERSGAAVWFEGEVEKGVRAPHNFLLNTLARLGVIGFVLLGWLVVALARTAFRQRTRKSDGDEPPGDLDDIAVLVVATLFAASLVGVILESPFGAVPFWWAAGLLLVQKATAPAVEQATGGQATDRTTSA